MDAQDSSISKQSPEVRLDMSSKEMVTDQATQDMSSKDMISDQANQDRRNMTKEEVYIESILEGMPTDKAPQAGPDTTKEVRVEGSSNGMAALGENFNRSLEQKHIISGSFEMRVVGSSNGMADLREEFNFLLKQKFWISESKVLPTAVVKEEYRSLFKAAVTGNWEEIEKSLNENNTAMTAEVMNVKAGEPFTILDVAIKTAQDQLVENLVKRFPPNCKDLNLDRAFLHAARGGRIRMVEALIDKIDANSKIIHKGLEFVLESAPAQKKVIWYLARHLKSTPDFKSMIILLMAGHLDICLYLAKKYPEVYSKETQGGVRLLYFLAPMIRYFESGARLNLWEKPVYKFIPKCLIIPRCLVDTPFDDSKDTKMPRVIKWFISLWNLVTIPAPIIKRNGELKLRHYCSHELAKLALKVMEKNTTETLEFPLTSRVVLDAASSGVLEIVRECLERFPELMWDHSFAKQLITEIVKGRHVELFRLVSTYEPLRGLFDDIDLVEAVTKWSPRCVTLDVSGAAFLMQRELQWFQVVEIGSYPSFKWLKFQVEKKSYWEEFVDQRSNLLKEAREWMKDTSSQCSVVATLIITIAFGAAFAVPGGNDNSTGIPIFWRNVLSTVFAVADAIALFCSVAAALMFLAILTSRYAIEDFHNTLPRRMVRGLTFLFLSLVFMLVAFGSALLIVLSNRWKSIYILITLLAGFPVASLPILQLLPLYIDMVQSTAWPPLYKSKTRDLKSGASLIQ